MKYNKRGLTNYALQFYHYFCFFVQIHVNTRGTVASWWVHSSLDRAVQVWALAGDIVFLGKTLYSLTVPLSAQVYKWVPANLMLGVTLRWSWTSTLSRGYRKNSYSLHATETGICCGLMGFLAHMQTLPFTLCGSYWPIFSQYKPSAGSITYIYIVNTGKVN